MNVASLAYLALMALGAVTGFLKFFVLGRILPKADFGQYSYLISIVNYGLPVATFGVLEGLSRRFPILIGEERHDEAYTLRNAAMGTTVLSAAAAVILTATIAATVQAVTGRQVLMVSLVVAVQIYAYVAFTFGLRDIRNHLKTALYAAVTCGKALCDLALAFVIAPRFGYFGVLVGETFVFALVSLVIYLVWMERASIAVTKFRLMTPLIGEGILISIGAALSNTTRMADRLVLGTVLPKERFADYAFHLVVISAGAIAANVLSQWVGPRSLHLFGRSAGDIGAVSRYLGRLTFWLLAAGIACAGFVPLGFHWVAAHFFTRYTVDHPLLMVLYAAAVIDMANLFPLVLIACNQLRSIISINAVAGIVLVLACILASRMHAGLLIFAVFALLARIGVFVATWLITRRAVTAQHLAMASSGL